MQMEIKRKLEQLYLYQTKQNLKQRLSKRQRKILCNDKGSIQEEDITMVNIYATNIGAPKYIKELLTDIKGEIDNNTIIVGEI